MLVEKTPTPMTLLGRIGKLAAPTMVLSLFGIWGQLSETWLAARQGTPALAGWAVVLPFALLLQQMSGGAMGGGVVSAIARALGAGRRDEASSLVLHALLIATAAGLVFAIALAGFPYAIFGAIAGPEAARAAAPYAMWLFGLGAIPAWLSNTLASILRGGGRHGIAAMSILSVFITFPFLAWGAMEPLGLGMAGLGMVFATLSWISTVVMAVIVWRGGAGFKPSFKFRLQPELFGRILGVGLIACALASVANLTTILVTAQIASGGAAAVAAYGISARLEFLMIPLAFGVGSALTALVGQAVGRGDWTTARRTAWAGGLAAFAVTGATGALVGVFPHAFASAFTNDAEVVAIATRALGYIAPAFGGFGLGMAMYFASMGTGRMGWPVAGGLARILLAVGVGWALANWGGMGLEGNFLGVALGITAYGLIIASSVRPAVWRNRVTGSNR